MSNPIYPTSQTPQEIMLANLKQMMPEAFSEGQLNISKLTALLSEQDIAPAQEAYGLSWAGKHQVYRELKTPTSQTLLPAPDESVDFDTSQNLFIEGDNLAVLKILQKSYHSRIKMIYIDPPYNTGSDRFVYADDFSESIADYKARAGQTDEDGNLTHSDGMRGNRKENGQYHSNWLNMMYPRLALAKSLLREDGVIFVSIDDNEVANLRLLMDEIFGEENFVAEICHKSRASISNDKIISSNHNFILLYTKNIVPIHNNRRLIGLEPNLEGFSNPDNDKRGAWKSAPVDGPGGASKGNPYYTFMGVEGYFRFSKETMQKKYDDGLIIKTKNGLQQKYFLEQAKRSRKTDNTWWDDGGLTSTATRKLQNLIGGKYFDTPKPVELIERMLKLFASNIEETEAIILDFFAGSSTTAHAVMALNAEDAQSSEAGKRKFIMVQIPEATEADSEAYKAGFSNIAEISKERIRRAATHIKAELPESVDADALDFGFKAYKLANSNFIPWQQPATYDADSLMAQLEKHLDPIADTATTDGIITELMLKEGYTLTATVSKADGYYLVTQNDALNQSVDEDASERLDSAGTSMSLAIVLDDMTTAKATQIITTVPNKTLIMDRAFSDDANKANIVLQFEDAGLVVGCV